MGRAWLWTGSFGILLDFPVVALEIGFLPGREEVESQPSLSSPLLQAFMKVSLVFRVGKEGVVLRGKRLQGQGSTPGSSGSQEKENPFYQITCRLSQWGISLTNDYSGRSQPPVGGTTPGQMVLGYTEKLGEPGGWSQ